jgi:MraZ protein
MRTRDTIKAGNSPREGRLPVDSKPTANTNEGFAFTFHGSYTRAVDAKGRFALPFRLRQAGTDQSEEKYMVSRGADGTLSLQPYEVWVASFNRLREEKPSQKLRDYLRRMSANSTQVSVDAQGRVAIAPERLAEFGIDKKITVLGVGSYMELWSPEALAARDQADENDAEFDDEFFR